jgi:hypothetical protein
MSTTNHKKKLALKKLSISALTGLETVKGGTDNTNLCVTIILETCCGPKSKPITICPQEPTEMCSQ